MVATLEAKILISAADQASRVFGQVGVHARELAAQIERTGHSFTLAKSMAVGWNRELESTARAMRNTGLIMTGAITAPIGLFAKSTLAAAKTHVEAQARIRASLRSTGREVEFTAQQLGKMAEELSAGTTFDDKEILEGTNSLLKFGRIHGQVFERAQKAAVDLAAAQHMEVKEAAETLGVALQDPEKAGRKLRGIGIVLSEFQKAQIHNLQLTGQTAKAQGIIMDAVAKAFAGQAKEIAETPFGQMKQFEVALNEAKEALGEGLAETLQPFIRQARDAAREVQHLAEEHTYLAGTLGAVTASAGPALTFLGQLGLAAFALQGPLKGMALAALAFTRALWPLGVAIGVAGLVAGLFKLGKSHKSAADFAREEAESLGLLKGKLDGTTASVNKLSAAELARQRQLGIDRLTWAEKALKDQTAEFSNKSAWDIAKRGDTRGMPKEALGIAKSFREGKIGLLEFENEIVQLRDKMEPGPQKDFLRQFIDESINPALKELKELQEKIKEFKNTNDALARSKPAGEPSGRLPRPPAPSFTSPDYRPGGLPRGEPTPGWGATPGLGAPGGWRLPGGAGGRPGGTGGGMGGTPAPIGPRGGGSLGGSSTPPVGPQPDLGARPGGGGGRVEQYMRGLMNDPELHLTREQAAGVVGNLSHESGGFTQYQELNPISGRGGAGDAQWTGPRRGQFKSWVQSQGLNPRSFEANFGNLKRELLTSEAGSLQALRQTRTVAEATGSFENTYERAGIVAMGSRQRRAQQAFLTPDASTAQPSGSNLAEMFARGGGRLSSSSSQVEIGKGTVDLNVSVDGPGKISSIKPQASGNFDFGDITVDRVGQRFKRASGLR